MTKIFLSLIFTLCSIAGYCQFELDTIPFTLNESNNILVEAVLNDSDTLEFMFHTGVNSISLTPEVSERISRNKLVKETDSRSWTDTKSVVYITNNVVQIGGQKMDSLTVWLDLLSGPDSQGKFGPNFFENKRVEINFNKGVIVLHDDLASIQSLTEYKEIPYHKTEHNSMYAVSALFLNDKYVAHEFLIHSGYGGTLILDSQFKKSNPSLSNLTILDTKELKDSFGNSIFTKKVTLDSFTSFGQEFKDFPISYFDSDLDIQKTSVLGCELLRRFNLIIDQANSTLYVRPNKYFNDSFE